MQHNFEPSYLISNLVLSNTHTQEQNHNLTEHGEDPIDNLQTMGIINALKTGNGNVNENSYSAGFAFITIQPTKLCVLAIISFVLQKQSIWT